MIAAIQALVVQIGLFLLSTGSGSCFRTALFVSTTNNKSYYNSLHSMPSDDNANTNSQPITGSFFNPVPSEEMDQTNPNLNLAMDSPTPRILDSSQIPVAKMTGFGSRTTTTTTTTEEITFVTKKITKTKNDVNNLQYDEQGYTLYSNEQTGEKARVFDALVQYPCEFDIKIVGANDGTFVMEMIQLVATSCEVTTDEIKWRERVNGKWTSITVTAPVKTSAMLYELYETIDADSRVRFKF
mmetsp:Transcript_438/g.652  ORF Transcript_438/g.652 Transcript_438/m.652 type:complete len:241 (-) Transcript_438:210-932(-)